MVRLQRILIDHAEIGSSSHEHRVDDFALAKTVKTLQGKPAPVSEKAKDVTVCVALIREDACH